MPLHNFWVLIMFYCGSGVEWQHLSLLLTREFLLQSRGPEAAAVQRLLQRRKQALEELKTSVEQRLRLRRLQRDPKLDEQRFMSCCQRLLNKSMVLSNLMEGMSYRISHVNSVEPDGSFINLSWDFEI